MRVDRDGALLWQGKVPSEPSPLIVRLAQWSGAIDLAGIEACPLLEWLHRALREAGVPIVCIEARHAQRFLSSRPVKTDRNDARGIAEMMRLGHYRPVHVKSPTVRTTLAVRMQLVASRLQIENTIRGLLKVYGLKFGTRRASRANAACVSVRRDRPLRPYQQVWRPDAAPPALRSRVGANDTHTQMVTAGGLGHLRR